MRSFLIVFCLLIMFGFLQTLKSGDDGVCAVKISTRKTRIRMVTINKMCGKKKCVKKKVESYTVPEERIVCCKGWEYLANDTCGPICSTGCVGGQCVAPEVCQCEPPAILDLEHKNTCIQPECEPSCVNSVCGTNNTCNCLPEFSSYNKTHCYKCDEGYTINEDFNCEPSCKQNCTNGFCSALNTCSCNEGYKTAKDTCEPVCNSCVNAKCVAPNKCECLEGYEEENKTCVPRCENCEGDCVAPNVCVCREGYKEVNGSCKPVCGECVNGFCSFPGQCTCNDGFVKNDSKSNVCVRSCERPFEADEV